MSNPYGPRRPALGKTRGRLFDLADDIERHNLFGGTRSAEAANDIRAMCDSIWDLIESRCDDWHALQCAQEEVEELRDQRDELLAAAKMAHAILKVGGVVPIDGMTSLSLAAAIEKAEGRA